MSTNKTDSGWRKRQIALDVKAENARELGLDYEPDKTIEEMAREAGLQEHIVFSKALEAFAELVRADEREALTPRCWTQEMNDAWNKSIPDLTLAFDGLMRARGEQA